MFDTQGFEAPGELQVDTGEVSSAPDAPTKPLTFPTTLKEIATYEGISEASLRNKWFAPKVVPIYQGYECPSLRSENGKYITEFGYQAFKRFYLKVIKGRMDYSAYVAEIQAGLNPLPSEPSDQQQEEQPAKGTSAIVRAKSAIVPKDYKQASSELLTKEISEDVERIVSIGETNLNLFEQALAARFDARGEEVGAILFERYQSGIQRKFEDLTQATAKKQEVANPENPAI